MAWRLAAYRRERIADLEHVVVWRQRPYYARMDVKSDAGGDVERYYLSEVLDDWTDLSAAGGAQTIHWIVPMARAFAEQPERLRVGEFAGRALLKRRFTIDDLRITDMGDALSRYGEGTVLGGDPFLGRVLAMAGERAGNIVRTIGRQQSEAVFERVPLLVVHGVPGSGKTQIGQMRVAYLVTDAAADASRRLRADECLILSPSRALVEYMEAVLPSFGVRGVRQESIDAFLAAYAGVEAPEARTDPARGSREFAQAQEAWLQAQVARGLDRLRDAGAVAGDGWRIEREDALQAVDALTWDAYDALRGTLAQRIARSAKERALRELGSAWDDGDRAAFRRIEAEVDGAGTALVAGALPPLAPEDAHSALLKERQEPQRIGREDLPALAHWKFLLDGRRLRGIHHVVVDEGQNVPHLAWRVLRRVVPAASVTVLGDLAQRDPRLAGLDDWHDLARCGFAEPTVRYLGVNYRSTPEVVALLNVLGPRTGLPFRPIESVDRPAPPVMDLEVAPGLDMAQAAAHVAAALPHTTAAILCARPERCAAVAQAVAERTCEEGLRPFVGDRAAAAGLEFDLVLVVDADAAALPATPEAASDLFVLASRAQNRVVLLRQGPLTPLLQGAPITHRSLARLDEPQAPEAAGPAR